MLTWTFWEKKTKAVFQLIEFPLLNIDRITPFCFKRQNEAVMLRHLYKNARLSALKLFAYAKKTGLLITRLMLSQG